MCGFVQFLEVFLLVSSVARAVNVLSLDSCFLETSALTTWLTCGACEHLDTHPAEACLENGATKGPSHRELVPLEVGLFHGAANVCQIWKESQC